MNDHSQFDGQAGILANERTLKTAGKPEALR
jgi:hypothetical protein